MERYYTIPMEVGLYRDARASTIIRSTSFYGLSFVRVTFKYGIDYYFAFTQTRHQPCSKTSTCRATSVAANPGNQAWSARSTAIRSIGPPHFGLTNLRTVQDWIVTAAAVSPFPGVVQVNTWGGTTKQYDVEVDLTNSMPTTSRCRR